MLAHAFSVLNKTGIPLQSAEDFDNADRAVRRHPRKREYASLQPKRRPGAGVRESDRAALRGKVEVTGTLKSQAICANWCAPGDEFSVDTTMNRIIKATVALLVRSDISKARKKSLKAHGVFRGCEDRPTRSTGTCADRNNRTYRMLMAVCWLVVKRAAPYLAMTVH